MPQNAPVMGGKSFHFRAVFLLLFCVELFSQAPPVNEVPRAYFYYGNIPIETNVVMIDSIFLPGGVYVRLESPYPNGHIFATADGTKPTLLIPPTTQPFWMNANQTLRFVSYSSDYLQASEERRIDFVALPIFKVQLSYSGRGSVRSAPAPTGNPAPYSSNTVVVLNPEPSAGWKFDSWSGDIVSSDARQQFTITKDMTLQANFVAAGVRITARRIQNDFILLQFTAESALDYDVEAASDLGEWETVKTVTGKSGLTDVVLELETSGSNFYRVVSKPKV
jgi:hypothetical protein